MRHVAVEGVAPVRRGAGGATQEAEYVEPGGKLSTLPVAVAGSSRDGRACAVCGTGRVRGSSFCAVCGSAFGRAEREGLSRDSARARPGILRRPLAAAVDRLVPLPFVAYLFPAWGVLVFAYQLLCDGTPAGRSVGKRAGRLRAVSADSLEPCGAARSVLRRLGPALCQLAYCSWKFVWVAVAYELASLAFVILNPSGRRPEDYLAGTLVVTERAYKRARRACDSCGEVLQARADFCPHCGAESAAGVRRKSEESAHGHILSDS
jgi:uncharacterized RDD family membrane protein YckC